MSEQRDAWNAATRGWVANYDLIERTGAPIMEWLVTRLDPQPGETFLDIGTGPGPTAMALASRVGSSGHVIATDIAENMLEDARRRAEMAGMANISFRTMDAGDVDQPEATVDGVIYRYGPMLVADPLACFSGTLRALRPGGRFACSAWGRFDANPWNPSMTTPLVERDIIPQPDAQEAPTQMFSLSDPAKLRVLFEQAGFVNVVVEPVDYRQRLTDLDEAWKLPSEVAGGLGRLIAQQSPDDQRAIRQRFAELIEVFREGDGYALPSQANCAYGEKPD